jgi:hypothetical protein
MALGRNKGAGFGVAGTNFIRNRGEINQGFRKVTLRKFAGRGRRSQAGFAEAVDRSGLRRKRAARRAAGRPTTIA